MTRLEIDIANAVKECKETGRVYMTQKFKTQDGFIYTMCECFFEPGCMSESGFFYFLSEQAYNQMEQIRETLIHDKFVWTQHEGRIINVAEIKTVWIEFDSSLKIEMYLDDTGSMIPASNPLMGKPIG